MQHCKYFESTARSSIPSGAWLWFSDTEPEIKLLYLIDFLGSVLFCLSISLAVAALLGREQELLALAIWEFAGRNNQVARSLLKCWWDSQQITFYCFELEPSVSYLHHIYLWRINLVLQKGGNCLRICYTGSQTANTVDVTLLGIKAYVLIFNSVSKYVFCCENNLLVCINFSITVSVEQHRDRQCSIFFSSESHCYNFILAMR